MERAIAYIRVSELRQVTEGNSLASQEQIVREYAKRRGYEFANLWVEEGESAKTAERPVLQQLLLNLATRKDKVQVLIIPKIDRFARYVEDYTSLKGKLKRLNIRLESVGETIEDSAAGRFMEMVLASVAQFDNEVRAERSKGGMLDAVREGRWVWKAPLGYENVRIGNHGKKGGIGTISPHPEQARLVERAFERVLAGERHVDVRRYLQTQGLSMAPSTFGTMLRNKLYIGVIEEFGEVHEARPPFVPIISPTLFWAVQATLDRGQLKRLYERDNPEFALRGTLKCECGAVLWASWSHGKRMRYPYYRCHQCAKVNIQRTKVDGAFMAELGAFKPHPKWIEERKHDVQVMWQARQTQRPISLADIERQLKELDMLSDSLALKAAREVIPEAAAKRQFQAIERQIADLEVKKTELAKKQVDLVAIVDFAGNFLRDLPQFWNRAKLPTKKKLQSFFYPNGLVYQKDGSFRTLDYPLLEQIKASLRTSNSSLVDPDAESANTLLGWFSSLYETFDRDDDEIASR